MAEIIRLDEDELYALSDALSYYKSCDFGGGDMPLDHVNAVKGIIDRVEGLIKLRSTPKR